MRLLYSKSKEKMDLNVIAYGLQKSSEIYSPLFLWSVSMTEMNLIRARQMAREELSAVINRLADGWNTAEAVMRLSEIVDEMAGDDQGQTWLFCTQQVTMDLPVYAWWSPSTLWGYLHMLFQQFELFQLVLVTNVGRFDMDLNYDGTLIQWVHLLDPPVMFFRCHVLELVTHAI